MSFSGGTCALVLLVLDLAMLGLGITLLCHLLWAIGQNQCTILMFHQLLKVLLCPVFVAFSTPPQKDFVMHMPHINGVSGIAFVVTV